MNTLIHTGNLQESVSRRRFEEYFEELMKGENERETGLDDEGIMNQEAQG